MFINIPVETPQVSGTSRAAQFVEYSGVSAPAENAVRFRRFRGSLRKAAVE
jgi:hypothetical protein